MRTPRLLALLLAAAVVLAGCGGEASSKPAPLETASAESPVEFVDQFVATLNTASSTLQTGDWRSLFTASCTYCTGIADQLDSISRAG